MPHRIGQHDLRVTASIGGAIYPADGRNGETLIGCADAALYEAKKGGGNNYRSFSRRMSCQPSRNESAMRNGTCVTSGNSE